MKDYLVDVPVKINIWIREECQRKQFEVIKKARPSILFIQSDGGRNPAEWEAINNNRKMIDSGIDWKCKVFRLYEDTNQGLYTMGHKITTMIWENVDRCIFLEDDIIPSVSYFRFCAELLEKYKDDTRLQCICGMNHLGIYDKCTSDYFFCGEGSIWGVATWKRVLSDRDSFDYYYDSYSMKLLKQVTKEDRIVWDRMRNYPINKYYQGHTASGEFWIKYGVYAQHRLQIIPAKNMISNLGCTDNSEHSSNIALLPKGIRRVFSLKTSDMCCSR